MIPLILLNLVKTVECNSYYESVTLYFKDEANVIWHLLLVFLAFYIIKHILNILHLLLTLIERIFRCFGPVPDYKVQVVIFLLFLPLVFCDSSNLRLYSDAINKGKEMPSASFKIYDFSLTVSPKKDMSTPLKDVNSKIYYDFDNRMAVFCAIDSVTEENFIFYSFKDIVY